MFKFLKDKLKDALGTFSKKAEEKAEDVEVKEDAGKEPEVTNVTPEVAEALPENQADLSESVAEKEQPVQEKEPLSEKKEHIPIVKPEPKKIEDKKHKETEKHEEKAAKELDPQTFKEIAKEEAIEAAEETIIKTAEQEVRSTKTPEELFEEELKRVSEFGLDVSEPPKVEKKKEGLFSKVKSIFGKKDDKKKEVKDLKIEPKPVQKQVEELKQPVPQKEKKGLKELITEKITQKIISEKQFEELFMELEIALLENNVAVEVMEKIKDDMRKVLVNRPIPRNRIKETVLITLKSSMEQLFDSEKVDLIEKISAKKPYVILFFGVNGSGKTTTIAKLAKLLENSGHKTVMVAADTFRAAAIQQLEEHAKNLNIPMVKKDYGTDPAAVAFDAIRYAEAKKFDVVLIDTAGRLHSNTNLLDEMRKIIRVSKPDLKIFIGESITGNDCVEQAKTFNEAIGFDAIILSKADIDEKGGAAISVTYVTKKPIIYIGTGQTYEDLKPFKKEMVIENLGL